MAAFGFIATRANDNDMTGGILVLDSNGDPVEFVVTDPISIKWPTRILFGSRLSGYIETKVVAPALIKSLASKLILLCFDNPSILLRKVDLGIPVAVCAGGSVPYSTMHWKKLEDPDPAGAQHCWWSAPTAEHKIRDLLENTSLILAPAPSHEPFARVREALMTGSNHSQTD